MITVYHLDKEGKVTAKGEREDDFDLDRLKKELQQKRNQKLEKMKL